jgi:hypothetical protein
MAEVTNPTIEYVFLHPEEFDWSGIPDKYEALILEVLEGKPTRFQGWRLYDRERLHKIVNENLLPPMRFTPEPGGKLRIELVKQ